MVGIMKWFIVRHVVDLKRSVCLYMYFLDCSSKNIHVNLLILSFGPFIINSEIFMQINISSDWCKRVIIFLTSESYILLVLFYRGCTNFKFGTESSLLCKVLQLTWLQL